MGESNIIMKKRIHTKGTGSSTVENKVLSEIKNDKFLMHLLEQLPEEQREAVAKMAKILTKNMVETLNAGISKFSKNITDDELKNADIIKE
jgi:hypothetical protein